MCDVLHCVYVIVQRERGANATARKTIYTLCDKQQQQKEKKTLPFNRSIYDTYLKTHIDLFINYCCLFLLKSSRSNSQSAAVCAHERYSNSRRRVLIFFFIISFLPFIYSLCCCCCCCWWWCCCCWHLYSKVCWVLLCISVSGTRSTFIQNETKNKKKRIERILLLYGGWCWTINTGTTMFVCVCVWHRQKRKEKKKSCNGNTNMTEQRERERECSAPAKN